MKERFWTRYGRVKRPAALVLLMLTAANTLGTSPLERLQVNSVALPQATLNSIAFGNGHYVAVGNNGVILSSSDAEHWTSRVSGSRNTLSGVTFGNGVFVVVGAGGAALRSADGLSWTSSRLPVQLNFSSITFEQGLFVAVGALGSVITSPNGLDWTKQASAVEGSLTSVAYGNARFVAVGFTNVIVSGDGTNWMSHPVAMTNNLRTITFGNGVFVAQSPTLQAVLTSTDGTDWAMRGLGTFATIRAIGYGAGQFVGLGQGLVLLSSDAKAWTQVISSISALNLSGSLAQIIYGDGKFVAIGTTIQSPLILSSPDGVEWASSGVPGLNASPFQAAVFAQGRFSVSDNAMVYGSSVVETEPSVAILHSADGLVWSASKSELPQRVSGMAFGAGRYVALANTYVGCTCAVSTDGEDWTPEGLNVPLTSLAYGLDQFLAVGMGGVVATSPDGLRWATADSGTTNTLVSAAAGHGRFVVVGHVGTVVTSTNAVDWTNGNSGTTQALTSVAFGNDVFVAAGYNGALLTSSDGQTWSKPPISVSTTLQNVAFGNEMFMVVGGSTALVSTNGTDWTRLKTSSSASYSLAVYGNGKFLISGSSGLSILALSPGLLVGPGFTGQDFSFSVLGEVGRVYQVQSAEMPVPGHWTTLLSVTNNHAFLPLTDSSGASVSRFYRLVSAP